MNFGKIQKGVKYYDLGREIARTYDLKGIQLFRRTKDLFPMLDYLNFIIIDMERVVSALQSIPCSAF